MYVIDLESQHSNWEAVQTGSPFFNILKPSFFSVYNSTVYWLHYIRSSKCLSLPDEQNVKRSIQLLLCWSSHSTQILFTAFHCTVNFFVLNSLQLQCCIVKEKTPYGFFIHILSTLIPNTAN